jgi:hypothetical protein
MSVDAGPADVGAWGFYRGSVSLGGLEKWDVSDESRCTGATPVWWRESA